LESKADIAGPPLTPNGIRGQGTYRRRKRTTLFFMDDGLVHTKNQMENLGVLHIALRLSDKTTVK